MAELYEELKPKSKYFDKNHYRSRQEYENALQTSTTVYVGNLSFYSTQDSIYQLFSRAGQIDFIKVGINDVGHPCGFCFVVYKDHASAGRAVEFISGTKLSERVIRVDWDPGYKQGREKGRGTGGQQKRDQFRTHEDEDRPIAKTQTSNKYSREDGYRNNNRNNNYSRNKRNGDSSRDYAHRSYE